jgi:hypothetical protein
MRVQCNGSVRVALPPTEAMALFTAAGERRWIDGWAPVFPSGDEREDVGAVWQTGQTTWVIAARDELSATYARLAPGVSAGLVEVRCEAAPGGGTVAHIRYDVTALDPRQNPELERFAVDYDAFMAEWERAIARAL